MVVQKSTMFLGAFFDQRKSSAPNCSGLSMSLYVWLCSGDVHHELAYENHELLFTFLGCLGFAAVGRSIWTGLYSECHGEPTGREELGGEKETIGAGDIEIRR